MLIIIIDIKVQKLKIIFKRFKILSIFYLKGQILIK